MKVHVLRLSPGEDLRGALEAAFAKLSREQGIAAACIVSAVGSLSRAVLRYAAEPAGSEIVAPLELLMLSGTLSPAFLNSDATHSIATKSPFSSDIRPWSGLELRKVRSARRSLSVIVR